MSSECLAPWAGFILAVEKGVATAGFPDGQIVVLADALLWRVHVRHDDTTRTTKSTLSLVSRGFATNAGDGAQPQGPAVEITEPPSLQRISPARLPLPTSKKITPFPSVDHQGRGCSTQSVLQELI